MSHKTAEKEDKTEYIRASKILTTNFRFYVFPGYIFLQGQMNYVYPPNGRYSLKP